MTTYLMLTAVSNTVDEGMVIPLNSPKSFMRFFAILSDQLYHMFHLMPEEILVINVSESQSQI